MIFLLHLHLTERHAEGRNLCTLQRLGKMPIDNVMRFTCPSYFTPRKINLQLYVLFLSAKYFLIKTIWQARFLPTRGRHFSSAYNGLIKWIFAFRPPEIYRRLWCLWSSSPSHLGTLLPGLVGNSSYFQDSFWSLQYAW